MGTTSKYGLYITSAEDNPNFIDWRTALCGDSDSNMTKIDAALGNKLDAPAEDGTAGQILTKTESGAKWADAPESGAKNILDATATGSVRMASVPDDNVTGQYAFAEGKNTKASGEASHAEGALTTASENRAHAEGYATTASGTDSHAEGQYAVASHLRAHAEGWYTVASGTQSHAEGEGTIANHRAQHVQGQYNIKDDSVQVTSNRGNYVHMVGNGTSEAARSNAHTLDWDGNAWFAGDVYVGSTSGTNKDDGSVKLIKSPGSVTDGQVLTYDGDSSEWVAKDAGGGEAEIFIATYNTTTYAEILEAYNAGKAIFCKKDRVTAPFLGEINPDLSETGFYFSTIDGSVASLYKCLDSGTSTEWSISITNLMPYGNYVTATTLNSRLNRSTSVAASDTNYTSYMVRGEALNNTAVTPRGYGQISWQYA